MSDAAVITAKEPDAVATSSPDSSRTRPDAPPSHDDGDLGREPMTEKLRRRGLRIGRHYGIDPFAGAPVAEIMTATVDTLPADATVGDARQRFAAGGHGAYPVVDDGRLVGIVSRGDILRDACPDGAPLRDHAASQVVTVGPTDSAQTALRIMVDEHVEHVPVLGTDRRLVGICTRTDLLKVRRRQLELERRQDGLAARVKGSTRLGRSRGNEPAA